MSLIQPYAPHIAEELWERLGGERLWEAPWPQADPALLERETFELVVQVNGQRARPARGPVGHVRGRAGGAGEGVRARAVAYLDGGEIRARRSSSPRKLVNFVTK